MQWPELIKPLTNLVLYSTNPQANLTDQSTLSEELVHRAWYQSNHVWASNHWLEDDRFRTIKSGPIFPSSFSLLTLCCPCVLLSLSLLKAAAALFREWRLGFWLYDFQEAILALDLDTKSTVHKHWVCGLFLLGSISSSMWRDIPTVIWHLNGVFWLEPYGR